MPYGVPTLSTNQIYYYLSFTNSDYFILFVKINFLKLIKFLLTIISAYMFTVSLIILNRRLEFLNFTNPFLKEIRNI